MKPEDILWIATVDLEEINGEVIPVYTYHMPWDETFLIVKTDFEKKT